MRGRTLTWRNEPKDAADVAAIAVVGTSLSGLFIAAIAVAVLIRGLMLAALWGWFMVPILHAPSVNIGEALGLSTMLTMFTRTGGDKGSYQSMFLVFGFAAVLHFVFGVGA